MTISLSNGAKRSPSS